MADLLAPPYDVIDDSQAAVLRRRSELNCVRLILPEGDADAKYERAAAVLAEWRRDGYLRTDPTPSVYVYRQTFATERGNVERLALFCALGLSPLEAGEVLPHERTHAGPKRDRLALTMATMAQFSPVFMIARDGTGTLYRALSAALTGSPIFDTRTPDGTSHALWVVDDDERAASLCAQAGAHPLLIADGHHRYETALSASRALGDCAAANDLMVCIVSQRDPGLMVQPTHRVLSAPPSGSGSAFAWRPALERRFELREAQGESGSELEKAVRSAGTDALMAVADRPDRRAWLLAPCEQRLDAEGVSGRGRRMAPLVFDSLVLRGMYGLDADAAAEGGILTYVRDPEEAIRKTPDAGCAFLLPPVSLDDVWATVEEGRRLPPKSTYFAPKMPSGILFRLLT
jgi:uncharacterized protein (DUF1015 family)